MNRQTVPASQATSGAGVSRRLPHEDHTQPQAAASRSPRSRQPRTRSARRRDVPGRRRPRAGAVERHRSAGPRRAAQRGRRPGLALQRRRERVDRRGAQPAAHQRRPHRHRQQRARRDRARQQHAAARLGHRTRDRAARRRPLRRAARERKRGRAAAQPAGTERVRARYRRRPLSRASRRPLPLRPQRPNQRPHRAFRPGHVRRPQQRTAAHAWPARPVLARRERRRAIHDGAAGTRRIRRMERRSRSRRRPRCNRALRLAGDDGCARPGPLRPLGADARIRRAVAARRRANRLGALQHRPLGLGAPVGLDLGRRCAVGLRAVSLRPLGLPPRRVVLVARYLRRSAGLRAGAGRLDGWLACQRFHQHRRRPAGGLVPAGTARGLRAELPHQHDLRAQRQRDAGDEHHQHHHHRQQPQRRSRSPRFRQPPLPERCDGRARERDDGPAAGRTGRGAVPRQPAGPCLHRGCQAGQCGHGAARGRACGAAGARRRQPARTETAVRRSRRGQRCRPGWQRRSARRPAGGQRRCGPWRAGRHATVDAERYRCDRAPTTRRHRTRAAGDGWCSASHRAAKPGAAPAEGR